MSSYRCLACVTAKQIENIKTKVGELSDVEGFASLSPADQAAVMAKSAGGDGAAAKAKAKAKAEAKVKAKAEAKAKGKAKAKEAAAAPPAEASAGADEAAQHAFLDAAKAYKLAEVKKLISVTPSLVNAQPCGRWSALHQFAAAGNTQACKFLLESGADPDTKAKDGTTPREVATKTACIKLLAVAAPIAREQPAEERGEEEEAEEEAPPPPPAPADKKRKADAPATAAPPAKKKGIPVDSAVPNHALYKVVGDWSATLNQTNVGHNNNKYYKLQVLERDGTYYIFTHWGRVGAAGQHDLSAAGNEALAQNGFKTKFKQKTGIHYEVSADHDWTPKVGKYTLVETAAEEGAEDGGGAPLGKLTAAQIEKGQAVLKKLDTALEGGKKVHTELVDLSSQYYTLIPHDFGFALPPAITTRDMLEAEEELLKFYLRMGFEEVDRVDSGLTPIAGIMDLALPATLEAACGKICSAKSVISSSKKGEQHHQSQSGSPTKDMPAHLYGAIMLYTSNAIYQELNSALRSEDRSKIKKYFPYLRLLLEALGRLPQQKRTLWRGVSVDLHDQYTVGSTVTWWGISSCTADQSVARNFMKGCGGNCTLFTVNTKTAADISKITFFGNEKESLLAPGTQLKVLDSKKNGKITEITIEEVGRELK